MKGTKSQEYFKAKGIDYLGIHRLWGDRTCDLVFHPVSHVSPPDVEHPQKDGEH
jgi:hypothetical protein